MAEVTFDALVIGGGPGGSTAAAFLAKSGRRVLLLEKERFPRFHIGESLLPYNRILFEELGVLPKLEAAGLIRKYGAQFHLGNCSKSLKLVFRRGKFTREPEAYQVERATFDDVLLRHAQSFGVDVREGWTAGKFHYEANGVSLEVKAPDGSPNLFHGKFLIDASGRGNTTGNQEKLRVDHHKLKKLAIFGHFTGVKLDQGTSGGDTVIIRLKDKWFWIIPITPEKTSIGCVMDKEEFAQRKQNAETIFEDICDATPAVRERIKTASRIGPIHTTTDFSYHNRSLAGRRLLRVGDAAAFMDPIFSAGVYLAMYSGKLAAQAVHDSIADGSDGQHRLARYERRIFCAMKQYWELVEGYYTTPFMELLLEPRERFYLASAVTALLAGEIEGGWEIRWRMRVFFFFVKCQKYLPLVPRISF